VIITPKKTDSTFISVGGKTTEFGAAWYEKRREAVRKAGEIERRKYRDITVQVWESPVNIPGKRVVHYSNRKGTQMPKVIASVSERTIVQGKRGRKSAYNSHDFEPMQAANDFLDITEDFTAAMPEELVNKCKNDDEILALLFSDNSDVDKLRKSEFGKMKRAAQKCHGDKSNFVLESAKDSDGNSVYLIVRSA